MLFRIVKQSKTFNYV